MLEDKFSCLFILGLNVFACLWNEKCFTMFKCYLQYLNQKWKFYVPNSKPIVTWFMPKNPCPSWSFITTLDKTIVKPRTPSSLFPAFLIVPRSSYLIIQSSFIRIISSTKKRKKQTNKQTNNKTNKQTTNK